MEEGNASPLRIRNTSVSLPAKPGLPRIGKYAGIHRIPPNAELGQRRVGELVVPGGQERDAELKVAPDNVLPLDDPVEITPEPFAVAKICVTVRGNRSPARKLTVRPSRERSPAIQQNIDSGVISVPQNIH